jgi:hypothetical protein
MLPPGHVAGGYLLARLVALAVPTLVNPLFFIYTAIFAFIPDLDMFVAFFKDKKLIHGDTDAGTHRKFISHAPLVYLAVYIGWIILFPASSLVAHAFILGTWSHFLLDSFAPSKFAIRWLYPFSSKGYSFQLDPVIFLPEAPFFKFWIRFLKEYARVFTFKLEAVIILSAIIILAFF